MSGSVVTSTRFLDGRRRHRLDRDASLGLKISLCKYPLLGVPLLRENAAQGRVLCAILLRQGFGGQGAPSRPRGRLGPFG
jgi:hypothetical protein